MMYPWSYSQSPIRDGDFDSKYKILAQKLAASAGYQWGQIPNIIGYTAEGSSGDYFHWQGQLKGYNTCAMAVEVATSKRPPESAINTEVTKNYQALLTFINEAPLLFSPNGQSLAQSYAAIKAPEAPPVQDVNEYFVPDEE